MVPPGNGNVPFDLIKLYPELRKPHDRRIARPVSTAFVIIPDPSVSVTDVGALDVTDAAVTAQIGRLIER